MGNACLPIKSTKTKYQSINSDSSNIDITPHFVITAYICKIERTLLNQQIIPDTIIDLCVEYYYTEIFPIFSFQNYGKLILTKLDIIDDKIQNYEVTIESPPNCKSTTRVSLLSQQSALLHHTQNITLPQQLQKLYNNTYPNCIYNHAIFKCGGSLKPFYGDRFPVNYCHIILIDKTELESSEYNITAYQYDLPLLPIDGSGNNVIFNNKSGLYSIGGNDNSKSYFLPWKSIGEYEEWNWKIFNNGYIYGACPYSVSIDNDNKILIFGQIDYTMHKPSQNQIYDIYSKQTINISNDHLKLTSGITPIYDNKLQVVYLCGASNDNYKRHVECYNIIKDKWTHVAVTQFKYSEPKFWMTQKHNLNILYVVDLSSSKLKTVEYIDLRESKKKWNRLNVTNHNLKQLFGDGWKLCT